MAVRRWWAGALACAGAVAAVAAEPPGDAAMIAAFERALTGLAHAAAGLALFSIVWAGFLLMAEGSDERRSGRARAAVASAVVGLALVLSARAVAFLLGRAAGT